ncbi:hypothetical protein ACF06N_03585 [Streptomyces albidoflavus]
MALDQALVDAARDQLDRRRPAGEDGGAALPAAGAPSPSPG